MKLKYKNMENNRVTTGENEKTEKYILLSHFCMVHRREMHENGALETQAMILKYLLTLFHLNKFVDSFNFFFEIPGTLFRAQQR